MGGASAKPIYQSLPGAGVDGAGVAVRISVKTGALTKNVTKTVAHNLNCDDCTFLVSDGTNAVDVAQIKKNSSNPRTHFDILVNFSLPSPGLLVTVLGSNQQ